MADSPQADARIQLDTPLAADVLLATGIMGQESLSRPFVYTVTMLSKNFAITPGQMLGRKIGFRIKRNNKDTDDKTSIYQGYSGIVATFSGGELHPKRREFRMYSMRVVPWLSLLDQGEQFRVFQDKDVLQVIAAVVEDAVKGMFGGTMGDYFQLNVQSSPKYPALQYCIQYGETDFNFVSRLMEQHGLHYFFEQSATKHTMTVVDGPPYKVCDESPLSYVRSSDSRGGVQHWTHSYTPRLRKWVFRDRDYQLNPAVSEKSEDTLVDAMKQATDGEQFEYPGGFAVLSTPGQESDYATGLVRVRMQEEESRFEAFTGNTIRVSMAAGRRVKIIGVHDQKQAERITSEEEKEYLITTVTFSATEGSYTDDKPGEIVAKLLHESLISGAKGAAGPLGDAASSNLPNVNKVIDNLPKITALLGAFGAGFYGPWVGLVLDWASPVLSKFPIIGPFMPKSPHPPTYTNTFTGVPLLAERPYRSPSLSAKPRVHGPQTAIVFGSTDMDVATDELGRVKVKFDWDRTTKGGADPETNSCFLRVVQGWAGPKWGMQFLPRVGDEVLVDFIDGDPDRPLITGRVYNAAAKPPFDLPKYRLQSGIKTRIVPLDAQAKDKFHMLRFDDTGGKEQVLLRSQNRLDVHSLGSTYETASGSRFANIGWKDPNSDAQGGDFDITVGNDHQTHVKGGHYERIEKDYNLTVIGQTVLDLESDAAFMVKGTASLNAAKIILEAKQKISLKVGGNAIVIDASGVSIIGTVVNINSGGSGEEAPNASIQDPVDAAAADTGEPGFLEKQKGGPGGGRKHRTLNAQHAIAGPRPGESPAMTALRNQLNTIPAGRDAMNTYDRDNVQPVVGAPGGGTYYTPPDGAGGGNTVTMDPTSPTGASDFVHEMNHADAQNSGHAADINNSSRQDYIDKNLAEESHGEVLGEQAHNQLAAAGTPEQGSRNQFTGPVYDNASQQGADAYQAANPGASQSDVDAAGQAAGEQAVNNSFKSGNVTTSNNGQSYPNYYGQAWDRAHPAGH